MKKLIIPEAGRAMTTLLYGATRVDVDAAGFLVDSSQWTPDIATEIARDLGVAPLTERHWKVIAFCREDAAREGRSPGLHRIARLSGVAMQELHQLFPADPGELAARIAGLSKPAAIEILTEKPIPEGGSLMKSHLRRLLPALLLLPAVLAPPAHATNGMFLTAYGAETAGRGGANIAVSDRSLALNFNPAGLGQLQGRHFTTNLAVLSPELQYENGLNSSVAGDDRRFPLPAFAYVRGGRETPWSWGVGFVGQGGMGATFEGLNTPFGTRDETYSEVRFATLTPTLAYSFSDDLAVGASLNLGYADASFRFYPRTSFFNVEDPNNSFFGVDLHRAGGYQASLRLGGWWRPDPRLSLGAIYQTKTESRFDGGEMTVNFNDHPLLQRKVRYTAEVDGFTFASQAGLGLAWRPASPWVIALDVKRNFWDDAIDTIKVKARDPNVQGAPPSLELPFVFDWKDQWVYALGADYRATDRLTLRAGYNHGTNPVPSGTLTPLFPATVERHAAVGFGWLAGNRLFDFAIERGFNKRQINDNNNPAVNPFGPGSCVDHEQWTMSFGVSWVLDR